MVPASRLLAALCVLAVVLAGCAGAPTDPAGTTTAETTAQTTAADTTTGTTADTPDRTTDGTDDTTEGTTISPEPHPVPLSVTNEANGTLNLTVTFTDPDGTVVFERNVSLAAGERTAYQYAIPADRVPPSENATTYTLTVRFDDGRSASREYRVRRALLGVTVTLAGDGRVGFGQYVA